MGLTDLLAGKPDATQAFTDHLREKIYTIALLQSEFVYCHGWKALYLSTYISLWQYIVKLEPYTISCYHFNSKYNFCQTVAKLTGT